MRRLSWICHHSKVLSLEQVAPKLMETYWGNSTGTLEFQARPDVLTPVPTVAGCSTEAQDREWASGCCWVSSSATLLMAGAWSHGDHGEVYHSLELPLDAGCGSPITRHTSGIPVVVYLNNGSNIIKPWAKAHGFIIFEPLLNILQLAGLRFLRSHQPWLQAAQWSWSPHPWPPWRVAPWVSWLQLPVRHRELSTSSPAVRRKPWKVWIRGIGIFFGTKMVRWRQLGAVSDWSSTVGQGLVLFVPVFRTFGFRIGIQVSFTGSGTAGQKMLEVWGSAFCLTEFQLTSQHNF